MLDSRNISVLMDLHPGDPEAPKTSLLECVLLDTKRVVARPSETVVILLFLDLFFLFLHQQIRKIGNF